MPGRASGIWLTSFLLLQLLTNGEEKETHAIVFSGHQDKRKQKTQVVIIDKYLCEFKTENNMDLDFRIEVTSNIIRSFFL